MSEETFEDKETITPVEKKLKGIFDDPGLENLADNVHRWPSGELFDKLPDTFWCTFQDGGREFAILRRGEQYLQLPVENLNRLLGISTLDETGYPRLSNSDLPGYNIHKTSIEAIANDLVDSR